MQGDLRTVERIHKPVTLCSPSAFKGPCDDGRRRMTHRVIFREWAVRQLRGVFGEPETLHTEAGELYRWTLRRDGREPLYVSLNSPEMPELAHVICADPEMLLGDPITSRIARTEPELLVALHEIRERWGNAEGVNNGRRELP